MAPGAPQAGPSRPIEAAGTSHPRGWARGRGIGHFTHQLPKMVARTLPSPSARMHPRGGEGQGRSPPHARAPGTGAKMELEAEIKGGEGGGRSGRGCASPRRGLATDGWLCVSCGRERQEGLEGGKMGGKKGKKKSLWVRMARGRDAWGCGEKKSSLLSSPTPLYPPRNPALTFPTEVANLQECK